MQFCKQAGRLLDQNIKPQPIFFVTIAAALGLNSCDSFDVVDKSKDVVISRSEYEQLKAAALQPKQVGRYQLHREGIRTWRLDTVTGNSCLLLTADWDWTAGGANQMDCPTVDYNEAQKRHRLYPNVYDKNGDSIRPGPEGASEAVRLALWESSHFFTLCLASYRRISCSNKLK
jgi:hypothetical protein